MSFKSALLKSMKSDEIKKSVSVKPFSKSNNTPGVWRPWDTLEQHKYNTLFPLFFVFLSIELDRFVHIAICAPEPTKHSNYSDEYWQRRNKARKVFEICHNWRRFRFVFFGLFEDASNRFVLAFWIKFRQTHMLLVPPCQSAPNPIYFKLTAILSQWRYGWITKSVMEKYGDKTENKNEINMNMRRLRWSVDGNITRLGVTDDNIGRWRWHNVYNNLAFRRVLWHPIADAIHYYSLYLWNKSKIKKRRHGTKSSICSPMARRLWAINHQRKDINNAWHHWNAYEQLLPTLRGMTRRSSFIPGNIAFISPSSSDHCLILYIIITLNAIQNYMKHAGSLNITNKMRLMLVTCENRKIPRIMKLNFFGNQKY